MIAKHVMATDLKRIARELKEARALVKKDSTQYLIRDVSSPKRISHLFDNVSEMTQERGVAMGTNSHKLVDPQEAIDRLIAYELPHPYLGFRCVAEIERFVCNVPVDCRSNAGHHDTRARNVSKLFTSACNKFYTQLFSFTNRD